LTSIQGPSPKLKHPTRLNRITQSVVDPSTLFHRTSPTSRSRPSFLNSNRIIPPLVYQTCISALQELDGVECSWADGEGDPFCVALAVQEGGDALVTGQDSDYVVLYATGYAGYVPLDSMIWSGTIPSFTPDSGSIYSTSTSSGLANSDEHSDSGFQKVVSKSRRRRNPKTDSLPQQATLSKGIIPPPNYDTLTFRVYSPSSIAQHLQVPPRLLPLLGSIVGNDFTSQTMSSKLFDPRLSPSQRITHTANVLRAILNPPKPSLKKRFAKANESVLGLINTLISELSLQMLGANEQSKYVSSIVDAILQYIVQEPQPLGPFSSIPHPRLLSPQHQETQSLYLQAYRSGKLSTKLMDVIITHSAWPVHFLEDPDSESCTRMIGGKAREWIYAVLSDRIVRFGVGEDEENGVSEEEEELIDEDEDELIDVVEYDSEEEDVLPKSREELPDDPLAGLRSVLAKLRLQDSPPTSVAAPLVDEVLASEPLDTIAEEPASDSSGQQIDSGPRYIQEAVRRGLRCVSLPVQITPLSSLYPAFSSEDEDEARLPIQLHPFETRIDVFLHALGCDTEGVRDMPHEWALVIISLRWAVKCCFEGKKDQRGRWTRTEARAFIRSCCADAGALQPPTEISTRSVQLTAQILASMEACELLSQALLLTDQFHCPSRKFTGSLFHAYLSEVERGTFNETECDDIEIFLWEAVEDGMDDYWGENRGKKGKKERKRARLLEVAASSKGSVNGARSNSRFGVLETE
jgi:hypothetical protein